MLPTATFATVLTSERATGRVQRPPDLSVVSAAAPPKTRSYAATPARRRRVSQPTNDKPPIINA